MDAMTSFPREIELKFDLPPAAAEGAAKLLRLWTDGREAKVQDLAAVYYDTPSLALRDAGVALRVRREGERWLQTAKSGAPGSLQRFEWEAETSDGSLEPGLLADTPVGDLLGHGGFGGELREAFKVNVTRTNWMLAAEGAAIEVSLDVGQVEAAGAVAPIHELELELKAGEPGALFSLARTLSENIDLTVSFVTKAERGYTLLAGPEAAAKADKQVVRRGMSAAQALQAIGRACLLQLSLNARVLADGGYNSDAVHQARVAMRRLRAALDLFRSGLLEDARAEVLKEAFRGLAGALGDARDLDVFRLNHSPGEQPPSPGEAMLLDLVAERRNAAHTAALAAVTSQQFRGLLLDAVEWLETGAWLFAGGALEAPIEDYASEVLHAQRKAMLKRGRHLQELDAHHRHRVRIAGKKLRYGLEFFVPAAKGKAKERQLALIKRLKPLQETLGELNDIATSEVFLAELAAGAPSEAAFAAGQLSCGRSAVEAELLRSLAKDWERFTSLDL